MAAGNMAPRATPLSPVTKMVAMEDDLDVSWVSQI